MDSYFFDAKTLSGKRLAGAQRPRFSSTFHNTSSFRDDPLRKQTSPSHSYYSPKNILQGHSVHALLPISTSLQVFETILLENRQATLTPTTPRKIQKTCRGESAGASID